MRSLLVASHPLLASPAAHSHLHLHLHLHLGPALTTEPIAVVLAASAAISFAVANVLQQRVAARLPSTAAFDTAVLARLARRPLWVLGLAMVFVSFGLQAAALGGGPLIVIEPVLASSLLFALALADRLDHRRMTRGEWLAAIATIGGLIGFLTSSQPSGGKPVAGLAQLGVAAAAAVGLAAACGVVAGRVPARRRALVLGLGGGFAAGVTDSLTKSVAALAGQHHLGILADWRLYLLLVVGLTAFTVQQNGYRAGRLAGFLPTFAVTGPVVGSLLGLVIYHEQIADSAWQIIAEILATAAAVWGITRLAKSSAALTVAVTSPQGEVQEQGDDRVAQPVPGPSSGLRPSADDQ